ncbi:sensor domain-containing protein [Mycolicibacterium goodii]|uniref:sensor domain-containing protein n=1 Tax=Mycolicibacterium goodii TaxID=134601 RepID=UPI001F03EBE6|nr:sensor domain-containing protein [Mycolicibacterium goodii]ULN48846.1 sensor domain-containing protein [Mycolicibacterium goodii]
MTIDLARRAKQLAAVGVAVLAVGACRAQTSAEDDGAQVDVLGSMLASASEIHAIMGVEVRPKTAYRVPMKNETFEPISRQECMVVVGNAMDWVYRDSDYREFREAQLSDDADDLEIDQAVARFDTPAAARALVDRTVAIWRQCAGDVLSFSFDGGATREIQRLATPSVVDGVDVTHDEPIDTTEGATRRAILTAGNVVVDIRVTGHDVDDRETVRLAKTIAGRNAL